jgi:hypothetical protein
VHAVRIKDGKASYANRFVQTSRLRQERAAGWPLFLKFGDLYGLGGVLVGWFMVRSFFLLSPKPSSPILFIFSFFPCQSIVC